MKLEYFNYMIGIGLYEENFLEVCKHYLAIYQDQKIKEDPVKLEEVSDYFLYIKSSQMHFC